MLAVKVIICWVQISLKSFDSTIYLTVGNSILKNSDEEGPDSATSEANIA